MRRNRLTPSAGASYHAEISDLHPARASPVMTRLLLLLAFAAPALRAADEPMVSGRTKGEYLKWLADDPNGRKRQAAVVALAVFGPSDKDVIPALRSALLRDKDEAVRARVVNVMDGFSETVLSNEIELFGTVVDEDKSPAVRAGAARLLGKCGAKAKPTLSRLRRALKDKDASVKASAAEAVGRMGVAGKDAAADLPALLKDADAQVRWAAVFALARIGAAASAVVPDLSAALTGDADINVRKEAARSLGLPGLAGKDALPALAKGLAADKDAEVRQQCALALSRLAADAKDALPALKDAMMKDADKTVRQFCVAAVSNCLGADLKDAIAEWSERLPKEREGDVRQAMVTELGALGPDGKDALPALQAALSDVQVTVREAAKVAIQRVSAKKKKD